MKIIDSFPPNIDQIRKAFDISKRENDLVYAYGDTLYVPSGNKPEPHLMAHEETHQRQHGSDPAGWWDRYIADPKFRLSQELEAYRNQYQFVKKNFKDRNKIHHFLTQIALDLSSEIYGNLCSRSEAMRLISGL